ncbi:MAG: peptide chain release factor N(5)-glutamine methyltransferase [Bradyrhizobiaceae bacterium]|nr:peptide chain release factor N(5)-glutamine methyltransferase [Bradyrhizobiaceae bacterium]
MKRAVVRPASATIPSLRRSAIETLRSAGIENAELDARVLLAHVLGKDAAELMASDELVAAEAEARYADAIGRRVAGEPVARIVGVKEFWSRPFAVSPDVLVPRPGTETVVEAALAAKPERDAPLRVLDLGIGSGAILGAILSERPHATGVGVDRSLGALKIARANLDAIGVGERAQLVCGNWGDTLSSQFDLVVANPPYIPTRAIGELPVEVRGFDPAAALDGGADGLAAYRMIVAALPGLLAPRGVAVLELGAGQEEVVAELARRTQLNVNDTARRDLAGVPRALVLTPHEPKKTLGQEREAH